MNVYSSAIVPSLMTAKSWPVTTAGASVRSAVITYRADGLDHRRPRHGAVPTEAGRAALDASAPGHVELVHRLFFDGLATEEVDALGSILTRLRDHVRTNGTLPRPQ